MSLTSFFERTSQFFRGGAAAAAAGAVLRAHTSARANAAGGTSSDGRYCRLLAANREGPVSDEESAAAWKSLGEEMALVPAGDTRLVPVTIAEPEIVAAERSSSPCRVRVEAFYVDRLAVTNTDFARFVASGCYRRAEYWPSQILPQVLQFVDRTGCPGPRFWSQGEPPADKRQHPVVGISWYEACAYARWAGKRLPTPAEWQRAGCWSDAGGAERKYPWGNSFDPLRANTWLGGPGDTVPADAYHDGCTANGIHQLAGNVWEWAAAIFECDCLQEGSQVVFGHAMAEIRGGAFDTYFESQATCQFRSGQPLLHRGANVGFRCCVSVGSLRQPAQPSVFLERVTNT